MTEAEWQACGDPHRLFAFVRPKASGRKMRLFAVAACRRWICEFFPDERYRNAVDVAERFADGLAGEHERRGIHTAIRALSYRVDDPFADDGNNLCQVGIKIVGPEAQIAADRAIQGATETYLQWGASPAQLEARCEAVCDLFRDVFQPFETADIYPAWLRWHDGLVAKMAQSVYDERDFDRLPVLGDALEEAGCTHAKMLDHCRGSGPHARGCWLVDLLLGRA
jgi:hypothetical protein